MFIADCFIFSPKKHLTPKEMMQRLKSLPNVGKIVYGRPKSGKSPDTKYVECTIMQLIASDMVTLKFVEDEDNKHVTIVLLKLNEDNMTPAYLCEKHWTDWNLIN